jgi:PAS domain S-box-containing protein
MTNEHIDTNSDTISSTLRRRAEAIAQGHTPASPVDLNTQSPEKLRQALHELHVHQIELEMQNEELRRAQTELQALQARYFSLYDLAPVGYLTLSEKGLILEANLTAAELLGSTRTALTQKPISTFIFYEDQDTYYQHRKTLLETGTPQSCELRLVKQDLTVYWAHLSATMAREPDIAPICRLVISDISERKQTLEALRLKNLVFDESLAANSIADLNGVITEVNAMFVKIWGYAKAEAIGKPILHFFNDPAEATLILTALTGTGAWEGEYVAKKQDGSTFTAHSIATAVRDENGQTIGYQSSVMDITERKHSEAELLKTQKLTSVGILAGGIAHDFNNILMGVFGNISLAKKEVPPDSPGLKPLENAEKAMARAIRLTKQLLTFAKGGDPVKENICLKTIVGEVARFDLTGSNVTLVYQPAENLWWVQADKGQIQQVISNLTTNARQAMPNGGHLYITLENAEIRDDSIPPLHHAKYLKITIRDEGCGIEPRIIEQIFEPYFTTKNTGSGLGLATAYSIIKRHGGHIGVISELGKGTTFTIYLPTSESQTVPPALPPITKPAPLTHVPKLLVLDDEEFIRMIIPHWLKPLGCEVISCENGRQAVELYKQALEAGKPFDLLILDLTIPGGIGGQTVLREILALHPAARAIVSSGYAEGPIMANFSTYGFKGVLAKPYTEQQLQEVVTTVLE